MTDRQGRIFQVSSNRGGSRHRLRYVESSASAPGECRLCVGSLADQRESVFFRLADHRDPRPLLMQHAAPSI